MLIVKGHLVTRSCLFTSCPFGYFVKVVSKAIKQPVVFGEVSIFCGYDNFFKPIYISHVMFLGIFFFDFFVKSIPSFLAFSPITAIHSSNLLN